MIIDCSLILLWWIARGVNSISSEETQTNIIYSIAETLISHFEYLQGQVAVRSASAATNLFSTNYNYIALRERNDIGEPCRVIVRL